MTGGETRRWDALQVTLAAPRTEFTNTCRVPPENVWDSHCMNVCRCILGLEPLQTAKQKAEQTWNL